MVEFSTAGILRRFAAIFYDSLLLMALLLVASAVPLLLTGGETLQPNNIFMTLYILLVCFVFFGWFWTHGGQTLGMRAWRIRLVQKDNSPIKWQQALIRFMSGLPAWFAFIFGIIHVMTPVKLPLPTVLHWIAELPTGTLLLVGLVWLVIDNWPNGWRDHISQTSLILLPKKT